MPESDQNAHRTESRDQWNVCQMQAIITSIQTLNANPEMLKSYFEISPVGISQEDWIAAQNAWVYDNHLPKELTEDNYLFNFELTESPL